MFVQNSDFRTTIFIAAGAALLGAMIFHEINGHAEMTALPPSLPSEIPVSLSVTPVPYVAKAFPTFAPPLATSIPTEPQAARTLGAILFQATVARVTQSAFELEMTRTAMVESKDNLKAERERATRDAELAAVGNLLTRIAGSFMLVALAVGVVLFARSRDKQAETELKRAESELRQAEAKSETEKRRTLQVREALIAKCEERARATRVTATEFHSTPGNGHEM